MIGRLLCRFGWHKMQRVSGWWFKCKRCPYEDRNWGYEWVDY